MISYLATRYLLGLAPHYPFISWAVVLLVLAGLAIYYDLDREDEDK